MDGESAKKPSSAARRKRSNNLMKEKKTDSSKKKKKEVSHDRSELSRDGSGRLLRTIGAVGLPAGGVAFDSESGLAIRLERSVPPLVTLEMVQAARTLLDKGEVHLACAALRHDDASTTHLLIAAWENNDDKVDMSELSEMAKARVSLSGTSRLRQAFAIERIGDNSLPLEVTGQRFNHGDALMDAHEIHVTYNLMVADEGRWLRAEDLERLLNARTDTLCPIGRIRLYEDLSLRFTKELIEKDDSLRYRVVENAATDASLDGSAVSIILALPTSLVADAACLENGVVSDPQVKDEELNDDQDTQTSSLRPLFGDVGHGYKKALFRVPVLRSKLSVAICRGRPLCGDMDDIVIPLLELLDLESCDSRSGESSTATALSALLISGLASSSPWLQGSLSLPVLIALWLCASADRGLRFAAHVRKRIEHTALGIWSRDEPEALWPWRGWRDKEPKPIVYSTWEFDDQPLAQCRDALRAALLLGSFSTFSKFGKTLFARILGQCLETKNTYLLLPLPDADTLTKTQSIETLKNEARLAAYDNTLRPSFLLLMQASLPYPPRLIEQHSLKALAELIHRLSSGINARAARKCLDGAAVDTSRFTNFLDSSKHDFQTNFKDKDLVSSQEAIFPEWKSAFEAVRFTASEKDLYDIILSVQTELASALGDPDIMKPAHSVSTYGILAQRIHTEALRHSSVAKSVNKRGRKPTPAEARAAFLSIFGERQAVKLQPENQNYWAMFNGDGSLAVQRDCDEPRKFLDPSSDIHARVADALLSTVIGPPGIDFPRDRKPPPGFSWSFLDDNDDETLRICVVRQHNHTYSFFIGDLEIPAGDATSALSEFGWSASLNEQIPTDLETLLRRGLYLSEKSTKDNDLSLLAALDAVARCRLHLDYRCFDWLDLAKSSCITRTAWRDALVKLACRTDRGLVEISSCHASGSRGGSAAVSQLTEGLVLRIFYILAALYPAIITRVTELHFIVDDSRGSHFVHLFRALSILAFGYYDDGSTFANGAKASTPEFSTPKKKKVVPVGLLPRASRHFSAPPPALADMDTSSDSEDELMIEKKKEDSAVVRPSLNLGALPDGGHGTLYAANWIDVTKNMPKEDKLMPEVTTSLWSHQAEARDKIIEGIREGKRGFADASTVGSGKSLTALSVCCAVSEVLAERSVARVGCLVLVPTNALITEWVQQAMLHTNNYDVIVQRANGALMSKGISAGGGRAARSPAKTVALGPRSMVITSLARLREHPYTNQPGWDFIIIDECLSVQSESAMQAAEAWRSVVASRCGVLMLSATLFRSSYSALFYLIRMLRSPIPRTPSFLPALLQEHVACYVPENRRKWKLTFDRTALSEKANSAYRSRVESFAAKRVGRGVGTPRDLYVSLKSFLREHFEPTTLIEAVIDRVSKLRKAGRKVIVFANTERELERIVKRIPDAIRLDRVRKKQQMQNSGEAIDEMDEDYDESLKKPLVLTVAEGSHGLNLQGWGDAIVSRPQPGDVLEQMKGRIDRPGQARNKLDLYIVLAASTIEEAEAANIRLVGSFFRTYLDPISKTFQNFAINAQLADISSETSRSTLAKTFTRSISAIGEGCDAPNMSEYINDDDYDDQDDTNVVITPKTARKGGIANSSSDKRKVAPVDTAVTAVATPPKKKPKAAPEFRIAVSKTKPAPRLSADILPQALAHLTRVDQRLAALISQIGPPTTMLDMIPAADLNSNPWPPVSWRSLTKSIVYQQLSTQVAQKIFVRLVEACGGEDAFTPKSLLALEESQLLSPKNGGLVGLSRAKASYIRGVAQHFETGECLSDAKLALLDDEAVMKTLCQVRGLGEWSCHMFLMFGLGRPDVLPVGDLAIQKGFKKLYGTNSEQTGATSVNELPNRKQMEELSKAWRPWRTIGSWYMWHVVETAAANWV